MGASPLVLTPTGLVPANTFGVRLGMVRITAVPGGWTLREAEQATGIPRETWRRYERLGQAPSDLEHVAQRIARATGISLQWLLTGDPGEPADEVVAGQQVLTLPDLALPDDQEPDHERDHRAVA